MVIEAGVVAGYVIAWAVRKARRAGGRLDTEVDTVIDAGLDKLHEVVAGKLGADPVLEDLAEEAAGAEQVTELTRQRVELAVTAAARKDGGFAQAVTDLLAQVRAAEQAGGVQVLASPGSKVFNGDVNMQEQSGGIAFGQVGGDVHTGGAGQGLDPSGPGRSRP